MAVTYSVQAIEECLAAAQVEKEQIIEQRVKSDISSFLAKIGLKLSDIRHFIFHPGGKKVLAAYEEA